MTWRVLSVPSATMRSMDAARSAVWPTVLRLPVPERCRTDQAPVRSGSVVHRHRPDRDGRPEGGAARPAAGPRRVRASGPDALRREVRPRTAVPFRVGHRRRRRRLRRPTGAEGVGAAGPACGQRAVRLMDGAQPRPAALEAADHIAVSLGPHPSTRVARWVRCGGSRRRCDEMTATPGRGADPPRGRGKRGLPAHQPAACARCRAGRQPAQRVDRKEEPDPRRRLQALLDGTPRQR